MSPLMIAPGPAELVDVDEVVSVSMRDNTVVVRPTSRPDAIGTQVLIDVVNAATDAGSTVALHRCGGRVDSYVAVDAPAAPDDLSVEPVKIETAGVGLLEIRTEGPIWTIDFVASRFVRTDRPLDRLFLAAPNWSTLETVWIGPHFVRALTVGGAYVASRRAMTESCEREVGEDQGAALLLGHTA